jgi:hypothetical protein
VENTILTLKFKTMEQEYQVKNVEFIKSINELVDSLKKIQDDTYLDFSQSTVDKFAVFGKIFKHFNLINDNEGKTSKSDLKFVLAKRFETNKDVIADIYPLIENLKYFKIKIKNANDEIELERSFQEFKIKTQKIYGIN